MDKTDDNSYLGSNSSYRPRELKAGSMAEIEADRQAELERLVQVISLMIGDDLFEKLLRV